MRTVGLYELAAVQVMKKGPSEVDKKFIIYSDGLRAYITTPDNENELKYYKGFGLCEMERTEVKDAFVTLNKTDNRKMESK